MADGSHPVMVQITIKGKAVRRSLFTVRPDHWDTRSRRVNRSDPNWVQKNEIIAARLAEVESRILECVKNDRPVTASVFNAPVTSVMLSDAIRHYGKELKDHGKVTWNRLNPIITHITDKGLDIPIRDVTPEYLDRLFGSMISRIHHNTATKRITIIRTVLRTYGLLVTYRTTYRHSSKDKLSKEELHAILELPLVGLIAVVRDSFALSFWLRGSRISDTITLLKSEVINGRVIRDARKTGKPIDMAIVPQAQAIIDRYWATSSVYVLPLMTMEPGINSDRYRKAIESKTAVINRYLKIIAGMTGINKSLTTHVARHTFAYLADIAGLTSKRIQDLLDHSSLRMTEVYLNDLRRRDQLDSDFRKFVDGV